MKNLLKLSLSFWIWLGIAYTANSQISLSRMEAINKALENNRNYKIQRLELEKSYESVQEMKGALLPSLYFKGGYNRYFEKQVTFMPGSLVGNEERSVVDVPVGGKNTLSAGVFFNQAIISKDEKREIESAKILLNIESQNTREFEINLKNEVAKQYYGLLAIQENIALYELSLSRNIQALKDSKSLLNQGKSLSIDTLQNYIKVENLRVSISSLESLKKTSEFQFKKLLGLEIDLPIILSDSLTLNTNEYETSERKINPEEALNTRPDFIRQKYVLEFSKNQLSKSQAIKLPQLNLIGGYQIQAQDDHLQLNNYTWPRTSFLGLQASVPIFVGNRINSRIQKSRLSLEQNELALKEAEIGVYKEIYSLEKELSEAWKRYELSKKSKEAAKQNFRIVQNLYLQGFGTRLELADAEISLFDSQLHHIHTIYMINVIELDLEKAIGLIN
jgi:outer membrane protein